MSLLVCSARINNQPLKTRLVVNVRTSESTHLRGLSRVLIPAIDLSSPLVSSLSDATAGASDYL